MASRLDPENTETHYLLETVKGLVGKRVLEIGCGNGRMTWRYAHHARQVVGIDPDPEQIAQAKQDTPSHLSDKVEFLAADILDFTVPQPFDAVIFSWSL
jgi:cyclopropane fatty-acyl-phospholipid synthase-like methyltransferase